MQNVHAALVKFAATMKNPGKDAKGNYGAFLSLPALLDHVRVPLAEVGITVVQDVTAPEPGTVGITTILLHESGESLTFGPIVGAVPEDWQKRGSAITYARRYALTAALGLAGDDDDAQSVTDAQRAAKPVKKAAPAKAPEAPKVYTAEQMEEAAGAVTGVVTGESLTEEELRAIWKANEALLDVPTANGTLREAIGTAVAKIREEA